MKILLTGFEPFGGEQVNPSWEAVRRLPRSIGTARIAVRKIPTSFERSVAAVRESLRSERPDVVVSVGEAGGSSTVLLERIAVNIDHARIPDNDGDQPDSRLIRPDGPAAYFSTLPLEDMRTWMRAAGFDVAYSHSAGTFVCNHVFYDTVDVTRDTSVACGFIHVPYAPEQVAERPGVPSLPIDQTSRALVVALEAIIIATGSSSNENGESHEL